MMPESTTEPLPEECLCFLVLRSLSPSIFLLRLNRVTMLTGYNERNEEIKPLTSRCSKEGQFLIYCTDLEHIMFV